MNSLMEYNQTPILSIIISVYNGGITIEKTLQSVFSQDYKNYEVVVVDGNSTDNTLEIINKYKDKINFFISERDNGIANAYNKGVNSSKGEWLYFLNADDIFCSTDTLTNVARYFQENTQILSGRVVKDDGYIYDGKFDWKLLLKNYVHHQSNFYRSNVLRKFPYNEQYVKYGHDHEHNILIWKNNISIKYIDVDVAIWASGGISDSAKWKDYIEEFSVRKNTFGVLVYPLNIFTFIRFILKKFKRLKGKK